MSPRAVFSVRVLEKMGAPLIAAANAGKDGDDPRAAAERVAELLGKAVQLSVSLSNSMDLRDNGSDDSIRLALVALASQLIAEQYRQNGRVPGDSDLKKLTTGLEAVLTFADGFAPLAANVARMDGLETAAIPADESQAVIQYIGALTPVINAVAAYSFGRPEKKLAQEIADRLTARASSLRKNMGINSGNEKQAELRLLGALAQIYVQCHNEHMAQIMALDEARRGELAQQGGGLLPMDPVWDAFDMRAAMAESLAGNVAPQKDGGGSGSSGLKPAAATAPPPAAEPPSAQATSSIPGFSVPKKESAPPPSQQDTAPPAEPLPAPPAEDNTGDSGGNPMAFFKPGAKKDDDGS